MNENSVYTLCFRNPLRSLISWHNMHRNIAINGTNTRHFAYQNRDFYSKCSLEEYYYEFARDRLQYDKFLGNLVSEIPSDRLVLVAQEFMAAVGIENVALALGDFARTGKKTYPVDQGLGRFNGYADTQPLEIEEPINTELRGVSEAFEAIISENNLFALH